MVVSFFYTSSNVVEPDTLIPEEFMHLDNSLNWQEESIGPQRGWFRTLGFHDGRLIAGGSKLEPQTAFGSQINDYLNFEDGANDNDGWIKTITSDKREFIQSMVSRNDLLVYCSDGYMHISGPGQTLTADTGGFKRQNSTGAYPLRPAEYKENFIWISSDAQSLWYTQYTRDRQSYTDKLLTTISPQNVNKPTSISAIQNWTKSEDNQFNHALILIVNDDGNHCLFVH